MISEDNKQLNPLKNPYANINQPIFTRRSNTTNIKAILCNVNNGDSPTIKPNAMANDICLVELSEFNA